MRTVHIALILIIICLGNHYGIAQASSDRKVVLITLDGLRWQELFTGADPLLVANGDYVHDTTDLKERFWKENPIDRREALMPFLWKNAIKRGQIHGNRKLGSKVDLTNKMWFSYPGYNEILSGKADDQNITSNDKINNPNETVLELVNKNSGYKGKVAAFGSWDVFPYIINEERSGVPVNAGFEMAEGDDLSERERFLNELQPKVPSPWGSVRFDAFTHHYALEYMKRAQPALVYIAYGETDDFAHDGDYEAYLKAAYNTDALLQQLWEFTQQDPFYKDNTIFIITTDHGRGTDPLDTWQGHGSKVKNADQVWLIAYGRGIEALGEVKVEEQLYADQIAPTILEVMKIDYDKSKFVGKPIKLSTD